jgi:uncharacterized protein YraI
VGAGTYVVRASALNLRAGPRLAERMVAVLPSGTLVQAAAAQTDSGWLEVSVPARNGASGWVKASFLSAGPGTTPAAVSGTTPSAVGDTTPATAGGGTAPWPDPAKRDRGLGKLHPAMRTATEAVLVALKTQGIPFAAFEAYRHPARQAWLYTQGRTRAGAVVTKARPWTSYHQYGLAVDFVLLLGTGWSWDDSGARAPWWAELHRIGAQHGLEKLSFEAPHLQVAGLNMSDLQKGRYPEGGDESWASNLEDVIRSWRSRGGDPHGPPDLGERPALPPGA